MKKVILLILLSMFLSGYTNKEFKITGYYPLNCKTHERKIEGGKTDCFGNRLFVLSSNHEYVSVAVDPKIIKLNTYFILDKFPGKIFKAVDVGRSVKNFHLDICVKSKDVAFNLPKKAKVTIIDKKYIDIKLGDGFSWLKR